MTINQETLHAVSEAMLHEDSVSVSLPGTDWMVVRKSRYESLSSNSERAEAAEARIAELEKALRSTETDLDILLTTFLKLVPVEVTEEMLSAAPTQT